MVISGLITTPMAFLWILPGLAVAKVHPDAALKTDHAIPWLLTTQLPAIGAGLLGFVLCGLVAAQVSTITADVNSVATLFTSDVYRTLKKREPTQRQLLLVVRLSSLLCGVFMLIVAWFFQRIGEEGAVTVNLMVVGLLDMPLFIITVVYGLLWRRVNWQGALAGFLLGGVGSVGCYLYYTYVHDMPFKKAIDPAKQIAPIVGSLVALIVTPIVTLLTPPAPASESDAILANLHTGRDDEGDVNPFHLFPGSVLGKAGAIAAIAGFFVFITGVFSAGRAYDSTLAVAGMLLVLLGGTVRVYAK
jgi:SSS family solute:Na+ symporter